MPNTDWYARVQGNTLITADAHRAPWTPDDIDTVIEFTDVDRDEDIALALGRTLHAVQDIQWRLRRDGVDATRRAYAPRVAPVIATCATHHIALTASGDCDWC